MALTPTEAEIVIRGFGKLNKLQNDLNSIIFVLPTLLPTKDSNIAYAISQIKVNEVHTDRATYVAIVQPLKDQLRTLKQQNETISAQNAVLQQQAQSDFNTKRAPSQTQIDSLNSKIKTYLDTLGMKLD